MSLPNSETLSISNVLDRLRTDSSLNALTWPYAISAVAGLLSIPSSNFLLQAIFGCSFGAFTIAIISAFFYALIRKPEHLRSEKHEADMLYIQLMGDDKVSANLIKPGPMIANTVVEQIESKS